MHIWRLNRTEISATCQKTNLCYVSENTYYCKRFAQSARLGTYNYNICQLLLGYNVISRFICLGLDFDDFGGTFRTLAPLLGSIWTPWGHFWSLLDALFASKNRLGRQGSPKRQNPGNKLNHLGTFLRRNS